MISDQLQMAVADLNITVGVAIKTTGPLMTI